MGLKQMDSVAAPGTPLDDAELTDRTGPNPTVRHFRQIVVWPLQLIVNGNKSATRDFYELFRAEAEPEGIWRPLEDEWGSRGTTVEERHYREFVSFFPHVQRFIYGDLPVAGRKPLSGDRPMRIFRRDDIKQVRLILEPGAEAIVCDVAHMDLYFFYDVEAAILVCEIFTENIPLATAEALIQRFGRAYPAGWHADGMPLNSPLLAEWLDGAGNVLAASDYGDRQRYLDFAGARLAARVASHWDYVLRPLACDADKTPGRIHFREIEYNRMPVMTYLTVDDLNDLKKQDYIAFALALRPPRDGKLPFSDDFQEKFDARHTYERHYSSGLDTFKSDTRFLTSGDVFTIVAAGDSPSLNDNERGLLGQFRHQYFLLFLIAHFHKAALLMISDRTVAAVKRLDPTSAHSVAGFREESVALQEGFLRFSQRYLFRDVSGWAHMRDLFRMIRTQLNIDDLYSEVRGEIFDMVQYLDSNDLRRQSTAIYRLTVVTIFGLVGTIVTGFLGMNLIAEADAPLNAKIAFFSVVTVAVSVVFAAAVAYAGPLTRLLEWMSRDR